MYYEPEIRSPLRIYIDVAAGAVDITAGCVWAVWEALMYFGGTPQFGFSEILFSTFVGEQPLSKGAWLSNNAPVPPPSWASIANMSDSASADDTSIILKGPQQNGSVIHPVAAAALTQRSASTSSNSTDSFNITMNDPSTNAALVLEFRFPEASPRLTPKSIYLATAKLLYNMAPHPNNFRIEPGMATDPDGLTEIKLRRGATDRRGRTLVIYDQAKALPRASVVVLTERLIFRVGTVEMFDPAGKTVLAILEYGKGPNWQPPGAAEMGVDYD